MPGAAGELVRELLQEPAPAPRHEPSHEGTRHRRPTPSRGSWCETRTGQHTHILSFFLSFRVSSEHVISSNTHSAALTIAQADKLATFRYFLISDPRAIRGGASGFCLAFWSAAFLCTIACLPLTFSLHGPSLPLANAFNSCREAPLPVLACANAK